jgi:hypothetical protein
MSKVDFRTAKIANLRRLIKSRNPGGRKLRLFRVACCRLDQDVITGPGCLALVDLTERAADGEVTAEELARAREAVRRWSEGLGPTRHDTAPRSKGWVFQWGAYQTATDEPTGPVYGFLHDADYRPLLGDILGPPPKSIVFEPAWRTDTAVSLARVMYEARDFAAMPILADALQDAGCEHPDVLTHCRGAGPHVRGCWVVDLVLGKS